MSCKICEKMLHTRFKAESSSDSSSFDKLNLSETLSLLLPGGPQHSGVNLDEDGCGYPITSWFGQLCHCFPPREHPRRLNGPGILGHLGYGSFSNSCSVVWLTSYSSRVNSAMRGSSIFFLTRASIAWLDSCFGSFLFILARCHKSKGITGQLGTGLAVSELFW
jgi:hypothetical protein